MPPRKLSRRKALEEKWSKDLFPPHAPEISCAPLPADLVTGARNDLIAALSLRATRGDAWRHAVLRVIRLDEDQYVGGVLEMRSSYNFSAAMDRENGFPSDESEQMAAECTAKIASYIGSEGAIDAAVEGSPSAPLAKITNWGAFEFLRCVPVHTEDAFDLFSPDNGMRDVYVAALVSLETSRSRSTESYMRTEHGFACSLQPGRAALHLQSDVWPWLGAFGVDPHTARRVAWVCARGAGSEVRCEPAYAQAVELALRCSGPPLDLADAARAAEIAAENLELPAWEEPRLYGRSLFAGAQSTLALALASRHTPEGRAFVARAAAFGGALRLLSTFSQAGDQPNAPKAFHVFRRNVNGDTRILGEHVLETAQHSLLRGTGLMAGAGGAGTLFYEFVLDAHDALAASHLVHQIGVLLRCTMQFQAPFYEVLKVLLMGGKPVWGIRPLEEMLATFAKGALTRKRALAACYDADLHATRSQKPVRELGDLDDAGDAPADARFAPMEVLLFLCCVRNGTARLTRRFRALALEAGALQPTPEGTGYSAPALKTRRPAPLTTLRLRPERLEEFAAGLRAQLHAWREALPSPGEPRARKYRPLKINENSALLSMAIQANPCCIDPFSFIGDGGRE